MLRYAMNKNFVIILIPFLFINGINAQNIKDATFTETAIYENVKDSASGQDAIMLFERRSSFMSISIYKEVVAKYETHTKIKILSKNGIEDYAKVRIQKRDEEQLSIAVRTVKKNGDVINLNLKDIKLLDLADENNLFYKNNYLIFSIPGVEVNDEIEYITVYTGKRLQTSDEIYLNSYLPCIYSSFRLTASMELKIEFKSNNGMPEPRVEDEGKYIIYEWGAKNLQSYYNQEFSIPSKDLPYMHYAIRSYDAIYPTPEHYTIEAYSWTTYLDEILWFMKNSERKCQSVDQFFDRIIGKMENKDEYGDLDKLLKVHRYICDSVSVGQLSKEESGQALFNFMQNKKIDDINLLLVYDRLFSYLKLNYYIGFARNKYEGDFDQKFVSRDMVSNTFLGFETNGFYYYLFLKTPANSYELGEIPIELQGTKAVMVSKKNISDREKLVTLDTSKLEANFKKVKNIVTISLERYEISGESKRNYSGAVSAVRRSTYSSMTNKQIKDWVNEHYKHSNANLIIDSVFFDKTESFKYPYAFSLAEKYHYADSRIQKIDTNLYSISLKGWFENYVVVGFLTKRITDYHNYFLYSDHLQYYLLFDKKIEINDKSALDSKLENDFGVFYTSIKQINEKTLLLESHYELKSGVLPKEKYSLIKDLEDSFKKANTNQLVIRTIN